MCVFAVRLQEYTIVSSLKGQSIDHVVNGDTEGCQPDWYR